MFCINCRSSNVCVKDRDFASGIYAKTFDAGSLLPVTLTSFRAIMQNNTNLLQWVTAHERQNKLFDVEHSTNGTKFLKVGEVSAAKEGGNCFTNCLAQATHTYPQKLHLLPARR